MGTTVKLDHPIKVNGKETTELQMRRPKVADLKKVEQTGGTDTERAVTMLARLTGLVPEDFDQLDAADYLKLDRAYTDFLSASPEASS
jgi:hypothetical protein